MISNWPLIPLSQVLKRSEEAVLVRPDAEYREITVRLWGKGVVLRQVVSGAAISRTRRFVARAGQFVLSRIDARNGAFGLVPADLDGAVVSNDFPVFAANEDLILPAFLAWFSRTAAFVEMCQRASEGTTNRVRLQEDEFLALEVALPPIAEQRRIVARIDELAKRIAEAQSLRRLADQGGSALLPAACERVFQELAGTHGTHPVGELCTSLTDGDHNTPPFTDDGVRFIFVGNVSSGVLHFNGAKRVSREYFSALSPLRSPKRRDVLYTAVGATLGIPALVDTDEPFCFQRHVAILKPRSDHIDSRFLWYMLRARTIFKQAWASTTGSAQPTVPLGAIRALAVPVPPLKEQRRIIETLDAVSAEAELLNQLQADATTELNALLPAILDRAFRGEL